MESGVDSGLPMRLRLAPVLLTIALAAAACGPSISGPNQPAAPDQVTPDDAVKAAGARAAARAFVQAYATDTGADVTSLQQLVSTDRLTRWVHWLGVQNDQFPGTISGWWKPMRSGPPRRSRSRASRGRRRSASGRCARDDHAPPVRPTTGNARSQSRSLDGPMRLIFDEKDGSWKVLDFTRDGIAFSQTFEIVKHATATLGGTEVTIDSVSVPYWEFFLRVASAGPVTLTRSGVRLVNGDGQRVASANEIYAVASTHLGGLPGGELDRDVSAPAERRRLDVAAPREDRAAMQVFEFVLSAMIHPILVAAASPSPSAAAAWRPSVRAEPALGANRRRPRSPDGRPLDCALAGCAPTRPVRTAPSPRRPPSRAAADERP